MHSKENNPGRNELKRIIGLVLDSHQWSLGLRICGLGFYCIFAPRCSRNGIT